MGIQKIAVEQQWRGGRGRRRYITIRDIAKARGVTEGAVRKAISRGGLDPGDLRSICRYIGGAGAGNGRNCGKTGT